MISLEMSSTPPVVTNNTSAGTGDDHEPSDEVATTSNGRHLDSEEEEILLSDDEYASLPPEPVQENGSQSFSPYKSPNSKIKDLIESPILNKSRMISRRGDDDAEDQVFEEPDPANSDDNNPTVALHFDATPELSRSNDRQIVNTPSTAIDSVAPEKFDVSPEANSTAASAAHAGAFKSSTEQNQDDPGSSPSGSQQKLLTASQRAITSYMVPRHGSPRAMAMLKAAAKAGGSRSPAVVSVESGDVDSNSASVTTNGLNPLRRTTRNSLISSSPSSTTLKRSHSVGDSSATTTAINSSPQSSPKRSSTYVPRTRGSLALQAAMRSSLASSATQYSTPVAAAPSPGPDELSNDSSTTLPANGASSFTPLARGSVCLQAAKAKQAEKLRRDTPMPKRAQSLPGQVAASTSLAAADTPLKPKSILRTSLSKDDPKSLYNARNFFNLPEIGRKPKRVLFTEPLVTSSVEFDANSSHLVICDTSTNSNTQQQANNGGAESGTTASSAVQPAPNTLATGQPVGVIVSNGTAAVAGSSVGHSEAEASSTGGGAIRRKPLYHQNSTFEDCDSFSPSKRSKTEHHQARSPRPPPPPPAPVDDDDDDDDIEEIPETDPEDNDEEEMPSPPVKEPKTEPSSSTSQYATPPSTPTRTTTTTTSMISDNNATNVLQSSTVISSKPYKRQQPDAEEDEDDEDPEDNSSGMYSVTMKSYAEINEMSKRYRGVSAESMEQENREEATADEEEVMDISDESSRESRDESSQEDESTTSSAAEEDTTMTSAAATQSNGALPSASEQELASSIVSTESSVMTFDHHPLTQAQFQTHRGSDEDNSAKLLYSADSLDNAAGPSASSAATQSRSNDNLEADAFMADDANEPMIEMRIPLRLARSFHRYLGEYLKMYESKVAQREQRRRQNGGGGKGNF